MNIITWNVRGLGMPSKGFLVKYFLQLHHVDICCTQESKLSTIDPTIWRSIGGSRLDHFTFTPTLGSARGIINFGWNASLFEGHMIHQGTFCLSIEFKSRSNDVQWVCTTVYGPNARHLKLDFWNEIRICQPGEGVP